ncbi:MAG TPA: GH92 family glycosyl hydrolase, partial [Prolixibacteraceae bacterium]|nr:GH92 family glycosyl hydrolase [Prolixibacteraceae bacterium]
MIRKKIISVALLFMATISLLPGKTDSLARDYTKLVDPMIGTNFHGHTFPGATVPFGMIQLSPDTRTDTWDGCSGYHYSDQSILGFSHTHFSGTGVGSGADIMLMPTLGNIRLDPGDAKDPGSGYRTAFSHQDETASPGFYRVRLENRILAELTCTERIGFHRYTYPSGEAPNIILDLAHGITTVVDSLNLEVVNSTTLTGFRHAHSSLDGDKTVWFAIEFSEPFIDYGVEVQGKMAGKQSRTGGKDLQAFFKFDNLPNHTVLVKVALSRVDKEGAINNLRAELPGWNFESVKEGARQKWQRELGKISVEGGSPEQQRTFYTALYHCFIHPNIAMDADRRYFGTDHKIHRATNFDNYTTFSLWDTFRALHPLFTIINQQRTNQFIRCFIERYQHTGTMMIMEFGGNEGFGMTGYHALSVIADAYVKGIRDYDVNLAFDGMKDLSEGLRAGKEFYKTLGFIPYDFEDQSVSRTLEYAYDDWCVSRLAKDLNVSDFNKYSQKGNFYQHVYNSETGFMQGKSSLFQWQAPFDPKSTANFTEGNAFQFSLFVPQDYQGLFRRMGGDASVDKWLDRCFTTPMDPDQSRTGDMTGNIGQYIHGNEPSHHMAYLYNYIGKPWKSQERIRQIMETLYSDKPDGLSGNEDAGQLSAWYVMSAMGLYATTPGMDYYVTGSPLFPKVTINLENGKSFVINAPETSKKNRYVHAMSLNGNETTKSWINHSVILQGGELFFDMRANPNLTRGSRTEDRPWSDSYPTPLIPQITHGERYFKNATEIKISCEEPGAEIRYTLDGTDPDMNSARYSAPLILGHSAQLRARSFIKGSNPGFPASA